MSSAEPPARDNIEEMVSALAKPAILVLPGETETSSYLGGAPPQFDDFTWPINEGKPLGFLGCIDLSQVPNIFDWLPSRGFLLFFYDFIKQSTGHNLKQKGSWAVQYFSATKAPTNVALDPGSGTTVQQHFVTFEVHDVAPVMSPRDLEPLNITDDEEDDVINMDHYPPHLEEAIVHQIGGYPSSIQSTDLAQSCQMVIDGIDFEEMVSEEDPKVQESEAKMSESDWQLLFQVASDHSHGLEWINFGMAYFWIKADDARNFRFEEVWLQVEL